MTNKIIVDGTDVSECPFLEDLSKTQLKLLKALQDGNMNKVLKFDWAIVYN